MHCISEDANSPIEMFRDYAGTEKIIKCLEGNLDQSWALYHSKNSSDYLVKTPDGKFLSTWYNETVRNTPFGNDEYIKWIAIRYHSLRLLQVEDSGLIVLAGEINGKVSVWAIKFDAKSTGLPQETELINLYAGKEATQALIDYLIRADNYDKSIIPDILQSWSKQHFEGKVTIRAILDKNCQINDDTIENDQAIKYSAEDIEKLLRPIDKIKNQPQCITDALDTNQQNFFVLSENQRDGTFWLWNPVRNNIPETMPDWYLKPENKQLREDAWITWYAMITRISCVEIDDLSGGGVVLICPSNIQCFRTIDADVYDPLGLLNPTKQRLFCQSITKTNYGHHIIKQFVDAWNGGSNADEMKIIAFFNPSKFADRIQSGQNIIDALDYDDDIMDSDILVETKIKGKMRYAIWSKGTKYDLDVRLSGLFEEFRNEYIARLIIAWRDNFKIIGKDLPNRILTFAVQKPQADLFAWQFGIGEAEKPREYKPLIHLYGSQSQTQAIVSACVKNVLNGQNSFEKVVRDFFIDNNDPKIRQLFPANYRLRLTGEYSPLKMLGDPAASDEMPPALQHALERGEPLLFLVEEKGNVLKMSDSLHTIHPQFVTLILKYKKPWLAWLLLADVQLQVVADQEKDSLIYLCLVSDMEARGNLWRMNYDPSKAGPPKEEKLLKANDLFFLSGQSLKDYIYALPTEISKAERSFFLFGLSVADFVPLDFVGDKSKTPSRLLVWRKKNSIQMEVLRVGNDLPGDQKMNLVLVKYEGGNKEEWDFVKKQYQQEWIRNRFRKDFFYAIEKKVTLWIGATRLGISKDDLVGVFLAPEYRSFNYYRIGDIKQLVDHFVYKPFSKRRRPSTEEFFYSWVSSDWDQGLWRANPLGFFDRISDREKKS